jgi:thioredoxin 1
MNTQAVEQIIDELGFTNASKCIDVTPENFKLLIKHASILIIDFWAPWCKPCIKVGKTIDQLAEKYAGTICFGRLNTDLYPNLSDQFELFTIPYFRAYKNGKFVGQFYGNVSKKKLIKAFEKLKNLQS